MSADSQLHAAVIRAHELGGPSPKTMRRAAAQVREESAALPTGAVSCTRPSRCFCSGRRYTCPRCLRFVPECYGAADQYEDFCDDCAVQLAEAGEGAEEVPC